MEIHQKKAEPDYHRLVTMVKRRIEKNLRMKNFGTRNGNYETSAVVKNQRVKQREQRSRGDCWQWKANGQCSKGDNCSFRHDKDKRAKFDTESFSMIFHAAECERKMHGEPRVLEAEVQVWKWLDCHAECLFYKSENGCKFGDKCSYAHRQVDELPSKKS